MDLTDETLMGHGLDMGFGFEEEEEQKKAIDTQKYKTKQCKNWLLSKNCTYGDRCVFAHGDVEQRRALDTGVKGGSRRIPRGKRYSSKEEEEAAQFLNTLQSSYVSDNATLALVSTQLNMYKQGPIWWTPIAPTGTSAF
eukprot:TRINITY_DN3129_c0_g1_i9.p1 TRINITY_DN3129_c0_g1~~TRINITY_DN3129_c0_g1_i9.p1  ORF type:complete len:139 (+),score=26.13 TRINITY_DN3129_c0_g1_i9:41-457(+)